MARCQYSVLLIGVRAIMDAALLVVAGSADGARVSEEASGPGSAASGASEETRAGVDFATHGEDGRIDYFRNASGAQGLFYA